MCMSPDMVSPTNATKAQVCRENPEMYLEHYWETGDKLPSLPVDQLRCLVADIGGRELLDEFHRQYGR